MHLALNGEDSEMMLRGGNLLDWCLDFCPSLLWKHRYLRRKIDGILAYKIFKSSVLKALLQLKCSLGSACLLLLTDCS